MARGLMQNDVIKCKKIVSKFVDSTPKNIKKSFYLIIWNMKVKLHISVIFPKVSVKLSTDTRIC